MSEQIFNTRIVHKHDTEANWNKAVNFIPKQGELIIYDIDDNYGYQRLKIGDGVTYVRDLAFMSDIILEDNVMLIQTSEITPLEVALAIENKKRVILIHHSSSKGYLVFDNLTYVVADNTIYASIFSFTNYPLEITILQGAAGPGTWEDVTIQAAIRSHIPTGALAWLDEASKEYLDSAVQASLDRADTALQSFTETDPTVPSWAKQPTKPTYTKSEVGLGNVDNVKQYSTQNPPPYPVTSVNGKTGAVSLSYSDVSADPAGSAASALTQANSYTDQKVAGLVDAAPGALNTLNELAAALGDDPNFAATIATQLGELNEKVDSMEDEDFYAQPNEPTQAVNGDFWIDTSIDTVGQKKFYNQPTEPVSAADGDLWVDTSDLV